MTHQKHLQVAKSALREFTKTLGYKMTTEADEFGNIEYFLSGGEAFDGEHFFAGESYLDCLETLEIYSGSHPDYETGLSNFKRSIT